VRRIEALNLSVLPAGASHARPYELLASPRLESILRDARRAYDYVLVDTPPLVPLADCRLLTRYVDGFVVVVAAHRTPRKLLAEMLDLVDHAKIVGLVFNGDDRPLSPYYGYYGHSQDRAPAAEGGHVGRRLARLLRRP
jgi:Mrp family chromosome partitioning ATPase